MIKKISWEIRGTELTSYIGTYKKFLSDQNTLSEKLKTLGSPTMLECKGCLSNQNISSEKSEALDSQSMLEHIIFFEWSEYPLWEIRSSGLTHYIGTYKNCLSDQNILSKKSEILNPPAILEHWSDQNISIEKLEALDLHSILEHAKIVWVIKMLDTGQWTHKLCWKKKLKSHFWGIRGTRLTFYIKYANFIWVISTSLMRNQRH